MKIEMRSFDGEDRGGFDVDQLIFGLDVRADIIARVVRWQLSRRQAGTHSVKLRGEIARTSKKVYRQKKSGRARHGSARAGLFRGGGRAFGPETRSHAHGLPKKVRRLGLRHALSAKLRDNGIVLVESWDEVDGRTSRLRKGLRNLGIQSAILVPEEAISGKLTQAASNLPEVHVLPVMGLNVYDIMRRGSLVLTPSAVANISARLGA